MFKGLRSKKREKWNGDASQLRQGNMCDRRFDTLRKKHTDAVTGFARLATNALSRQGIGQTVRHSFEIGKAMFSASLAEFHVDDR